MGQITLTIAGMSFEDVKASVGQTYFGMYGADQPATPERMATVDAALAGPKANRARKVTPELTKTVEAPAAEPEGGAPLPEPDDETGDMFAEPDVEPAKAELTPEELFAQVTAAGRDVCATKGIAAAQDVFKQFKAAKIGEIPAAKHGELLAAFKAVLA